MFVVVYNEMPKLDYGKDENILWGFGKEGTRSNGQSSGYDWSTVNIDNEEFNRRTNIVEALQVALIQARDIPLRLFGKCHASDCDLHGEEPREPSVKCSCWLMKA